MKYTILITAILLFFVQFSNAQFTLVKGDQALEISGALTTYYNYRFYPSNVTDKKKNRFRLRDGQLKLKGQFYPRFEFQIDVDFAALIQMGNTEEALTSNPFLNDAYLQYKSPWHFDVTVGYQKVPFSRNSMVPIFYQPIMKRPALTDGSFFHRRDVGVTLHGNFWKQRINIYVGAYNGIGTLNQNNDPSGNLEYVGRVDISYPARFRYREVDTKHVPIPQFSVGGAIRYAEKELDATDEYLLTADGAKVHYQFDAAFQFKGFSAQFEWHQASMTPNDTNAVVLQGKPTTFVRSGGFMVGANYYIKPIHTIIAARYDEINPNDLIIGDSQRSLTFGLVHLFKGFDIALRAEYRHRLTEDRTGLQWKEDEFRATLQFLIK